VAVFGELEGRRHQTSGLAHGFHFVKKPLRDLPGVFSQGRFRVKQVNLTRPPAHEKLNDGRGLSLEVRGARLQIMNRRRAGTQSRGRGKQVRTEQAGERSPKEPVAHPAEKIPSRDAGI
jgi:hypothetical protein